MSGATYKVASGREEMDLESPQELYPRDGVIQFQG